MFIDASAIVAILDRELGYEALVAHIDQAKESIFFAPTVRFEAVLALARLRGLAAGKRPSRPLIESASLAVDRFLQVIGAAEIAITPEIGLAAIRACATYGKIVGHPAQLNFGDCFAYACAAASHETLLFVGNDFVHTDLTPALAAR